MERSFKCPEEEAQVPRQQQAVLLVRRHRLGQCSKEHRVQTEELEQVLLQQVHLSEQEAQAQAEVFLLQLRLDLQAEMVERRYPHGLPEV